MNRTYKEYGKHIDLNNEVFSVMNTFKCLTEEELEEFFPSDAYTKSKVKGTVLFLVDTQRRLLYGDGGSNHDIVIESVFRQYSQKMIDATWVFLDMLGKNSPEQDTILAHKKVVTAEYPADLAFIIKNKLIKLIDLGTKNDLTKVLLAQENFYGRGEGMRGKEEESYTDYIFITRTMEILDGLEELDITIPHKIAYLEGDIHSRPNIKYFSAES